MKTASVVILGLFYSLIGSVALGADVARVETGSVTDVNGREYPTVRVGERWWMAENLGVDRFRNGDPIIQAQTTEEWYHAHNNGIPAWCDYVGEDGEVASSEKLYNRHAARDPRGIAPEGWSLPSATEFRQLTRDAGSDAEIRSGDGWDANGNGNNASGFNAKPGGYRFGETFYGLKRLVSWWTRGGPDDQQYNTAALQSEYKFLYFSDWENAETGFHIRCIKNQ